MNRALNNHYIFPFSGLLAYLLLIVCLTGCTEDTISPSSPDWKQIRFAIDNNASVNSRSEGITRGSGNRPNLDILPLDGGSQELYLVPLVENSNNETDNNLDSALTRGATVSTDNMESFGVFAGYASGLGTTSYKADYMKNVEITRESGWTPQSEYLWPGDGALHFNAYSPYFSGTGTDGVISISDSKGDITLDYNTPSDVKKQEDLLFSTPVNASSSPCELTFNHALAAIRFAAGSELVPCTVKKIRLSGILATGTLDIETGKWMDIASSTSFEVAPDISLDADSGSEYVAAGTDITSGEDTFMLIPQTLGEDALLEITLVVNGKETVLSTSLANQEWLAGNTVTYRISANPAADSLTLDVEGEFKTNYTGSSINFTVNSGFFMDGQNTPVDWVAEFVDDNGNVIQQPNWISDITLSGTGETTGKIVTVMQDLVFENMTAQTRKLQEAGDINSTSGNSPYNLSSSNGGVTIENTANTYIINAPGTYSIPLVYGNAIKNGVENTAAYKITTHHGNYLKDFQNHLGNAITSAYISSNTGCAPANASLIWEDELNLIRNVRLSDNKEFLEFDIPHNTIRQGNAIVAVEDADGSVMWSWQIWVTDFNPAAGAETFVISGTNYDIMTENLGYIVGGDKTRFPECSVKIRFVQKNVPDGLDPLSKTVELIQSGIEIETPSCNTFYQWGRKDPMMSSVKQWYDAAHNEIKVLPVVSADNIQTSELIKDFIQNPAVFYTGSHGTENPTPYPYCNLWNISMLAANVKSIYDPSPAGYQIPYSEPLNSFLKYTISYSAASTATGQSGFQIVAPSGEKIFFPAFGYRAGSTGDLDGNGESAQYWYAHATKVTEASDFLIKIDNGEMNGHNTYNSMFHSFSVRPVKEH